MGKKNKRQAGRSAAGAVPRARPSYGASPPPGASTEDSVRLLVGAAVHALAARDDAGVQLAVEALVERPDVDGWRSVTEGVLTTFLEDAVASAWPRGWQPADLARVVGRRFGQRQVRLVTDLIAADLQAHPTATLDPRWPPQLAELDAKVWWDPDRSCLRAWCEVPGNDWVAVMAMAVELVALLSGLPALELLGPLPGTARPAPGGPARPAGGAGGTTGTGSGGTTGGSGGTTGGSGGTTGAGSGGTTGGSGGVEPPVADERMLSRIRNLLAKAEATGFPAEAEALTAAAQERMARYSIDAAMLAATVPDGRDRPNGRRIGVDNPYEGPKAVLLDAVANANRCRSVWSRNLGFCTVIGFEPDLDAVETLFTSLLVQATAAMTQAGARTGPGARPRSKAFRQSFLSAYAHRIGERLAQITREQTHVASAEPGGGNLLPVLASRKQAVDDTLSTLFPTLTRKTSGSITDAEGWYSGLASADLAALHAGQALPGQE